VETEEEIKVPLRTTSFDLDEKQMAIYHQKGETETFRFIPWHEFSPELITLPIDKIVASILKEKY
jgi:8-oxo-dGTP diphosphatase